MSKKSHRGSIRKSRRTHLSMLALEPRLMFDAAAADTAVNDLHHTDAIVQPTSMDAPHAVIVVDARVEDGEALAKAIDPHAEIIRIDLTSDGLESLAEQLSNHREITALHLLTHGSQGEIELGSTVLNVTTLTQHSAALAEIGKAMSEGGDILLYGCDIAGDGGKLIFTLSELTHADVAASRSCRI